MKNIAIAALLLAVSPNVRAGDLDRAAGLSRAAAGAGSLEQARDLSFAALEFTPKHDGSVEGASVVDVSGASSKQAPTMSVSLARRAAVRVPSPARDSSRGSGNGTGFIIAGLLAPVIGAAAGALLGGGVGAVAGVLIGAVVGVVLLLVGVARALRHVFNP